MKILSMMLEIATHNLISYQDFVNYLLCYPLRRCHSRVSFYPNYNSYKLRRTGSTLFANMRGFLLEKAWVTYLPLGMP